MSDLNKSQTDESLRQAIKKLEKGDYLSNQEIKILLKVLKPIAALCFRFPEYRLVGVDAWQKVNMFEGYLQERKRKH